MKEIADILKIYKSGIENHLHQFGYVNHFNVWVPQKLCEKNLLDYISACNSLLKCKKNVLFLKQIGTGNEKRILYNNVEWKRLGASEMNYHQLHPRPVVIQRRNTVRLEESPLL